MVMTSMPLQMPTFSAMPYFLKEACKRNCKVFKHCTCTATIFLQLVLSQEGANMIPLTH